MTTNDKTREALPDAAEHVRRLAEDYADACVQAGFVSTIHCEAWHKMSAAIAALASTPAQPAEHRPGCDALGGYGHGGGVCDCGAVEAQPPVAAVPEGWKPLGYAKAIDLYVASKRGGKRFLLHYHGQEPRQVTGLSMGDNCVWVEAGPMMAVHIRADGSSKDGPAIWLEEVAATPTPAPAAQGEADAAAAKEADAVEVLTEEGWVWDGDQWQRPPERAEVRPPVLKDHEIAAVVNEATKVAREYGQTQQLRERLCGVLLPALKGGITTPSAADSAQALERNP